MIISVFPWGSVGEVIPVIPDTEYSGEYEAVTDEDGWQMRILTSGTLRFSGQKYVDIFAVGGGGGGAQGHDGKAGGGGGGGHCATVSGVTLIANHTYTITVGDGGSVNMDGHYTRMDDIIIADGGSTGNDGDDPRRGGDGGSGGGGGNNTGITEAGNGGSNGANGTGPYYGYGDHTTTREFGETSGTLYAGGGAGGNIQTRTVYRGGTGGGGDGACDNAGLNATAGRPNTGGGGGGGGITMAASNGGSGILIIRNHRG